MSAEWASCRFSDLGGWSSAELLQALWEGQHAAGAAIGRPLPAIAAAAEAGEAGLCRNGRLLYVGAGTSPRIDVQGGVEVPSAFDSPEERVVIEKMRFRQEVDLDRP